MHIRPQRAGGHSPSSASPSSSERGVPCRKAASPALIRRSRSCGFRESGACVSRGSGRPDLGGRLSLGASISPVLQAWRGSLFYVTEAAPVLLPSGSLPADIPGNNSPIQLTSVFLVHYIYSHASTQGNIIRLCDPPAHQDGDLQKTRK